MKIVNKLLEKVGVDKVLHFTTGAMLDALLYPFGKEYTILGLMLVFILSCVKELFDSFEKDNSCDWIDVAASVLGAVCMSGYYYIMW